MRISDRSSDVCSSDLPPFIGCRRMRKRLGSPYVDTLRSVYGDLSGEIDFVTYWWARSAEQVANGSVRGFGLITTQTIAKSSNRSVLSRYLDTERGGKQIGRAHV